MPQYYVGHAASHLVRSHRAPAGAAHHHCGAAFFLHRKRHRRGLFKLRAAEGDCGENVRRERPGLGDAAHFFGSIGAFLTRAQALAPKTSHDDI